MEPIDWSDRNKAADTFNPRKRRWLRVWRNFFIHVMVDIKIHGIKFFLTHGAKLMKVVKQRSLTILHHCQNYYGELKKRLAEWGRKMATWYRSISWKRFLRSKQGLATVVALLTLGLTVTFLLLNSQVPKHQSQPQIAGRAPWPWEHWFHKDRSVTQVAAPVIQLPAETTKTIIANESEQIPDSVLKKLVAAIDTIENETYRRFKPMVENWSDRSSQANDAVLYCGYEWRTMREARKLGAKITSADAVEVVDSVVKQCVIAVERLKCRKQDELVQAKESERSWIQIQLLALDIVKNAVEKRRINIFPPKKTPT